MASALELLLPLGGGERGGRAGRGRGTDGDPQGEGQQAPWKSSQNKHLERKFLTFPASIFHGNTERPESQHPSFQGQRKKDQGGGNMPVGRGMAWTAPGMPCR